MKQLDLKNRPMYEKKRYQKTGYLLNDIAISTGCWYLSDLRNMSTYHLWDWANTTEDLIIEASVFKTVFKAYNYLLRSFERCYSH